MRRGPARQGPALPLPAPSSVPRGLGRSGARRMDASGGCTTACAVSVARRRLDKPGGRLRRFPRRWPQKRPRNRGSCAVWSHPRNPRLTCPGATPHRARSLLLAGPAASLRGCGVHGLPGARRQAIRQAGAPGGDGFRRAFQGRASGGGARRGRHAGYGDRPG